MLDHLRNTISTQRTSFPDEASKAHCLAEMKGRISAQGIAVLAAVSTHEALTSCYNFALGSAVAPLEHMVATEAVRASLGPNFTAYQDDVVTHPEPMEL